MDKSEYDKFAEQFDKTRRLPWKEAVDFLENLLKNFQDAKTRRLEDIRILDVGCGNGRHIIEAKKLGLKAFGLDKSKKLAKIARNKTGAPVAVGDALRLPFRDNSFDYSVCVAVIHHFRSEKERIAALKELSRITKKSFIISVWAFEQKKFARRKSQDIQLGWAGKFPRFYHLSKEGELEKLVEKAGFKAKKAWRSGNNYWAIIES